jgi:RNA polymerase sigma-70 factor (ECF subfamily)
VILRAPRDPWGARSFWTHPLKQPDFAHVYDEHIWDVYGYLAYRLGSREEAEDLTQSTFERGLRAWSRYDPTRASAKTWLLTIAHNLLVDHYRASRQTDPLADDHGEQSGPAHPGPEYDLGLSPELADALLTLTQRDREVIALRFGGDLNGPEIAELLGLSLANVQQILSRSLRRLRTVLEPS